MQYSPQLATGGSPTLQDLEDLRAAGCQVVINLALPESPDAIPAEGDHVRQMGMDYIAIPVIWEKPNRRNLTDFFAAMDANRQHSVFVHCVMNMRVSAFIYLYRILRLGEDPTSARTDLEKIWQPDGVWAEFIRSMLSEK